MQEAAIHFVSDNVMRSYLDAISGLTCSQRDCPGCHCRNGRRTFESIFHFKTDFSHLCRFRCLHSIDSGGRRALRGTVFMLEEMIFTAN
ncbi:hypothetical protein CDAR_85391 [Caerostris darwini]|uniref:Uncharacterized protein n=1 Tax=Caerostris darwini TaxID=1538125 RepID=A0AAV4UHH8_9ARAC|nr:hypothetical protein CDAR_85391 [Caerostris darwini]